MPWTAAGVKMYLREDITMETIFGKRMGADKQRQGSVPNDTLRKVL